MDHKIFDDLNNGDRFHVRTKKEMRLIKASFYYWKKHIKPDDPLRDRVMLQMLNADDTYFVFVFDNKDERQRFRDRAYGRKKPEIIRAS